MLTIIILIKLMTFPDVLAVLYFKKYICMSNIILYIFCKYNNNNNNNNTFYFSVPFIALKVTLQGSV